MGSTAIEEFLKRLDRNSKVFDWEELMESDYTEEQLIIFTGLYAKHLQAKHDEELKQAKAKGINDFLTMFDSLETYTFTDLIDHRYDYFKDRDLPNN
jgi:hypothetical protein